MDHSYEPDSLAWDNYVEFSGKTASGAKVLVSVDRSRPAKIMIHSEKPFKGQSVVTEKQEQPNPKDATKTVKVKVDVPVTEPKDGGGVWNVCSKADLKIIKAVMKG